MFALSGAVRLNSKSKEATKDDIKTCVTTYLYNSRDLNGGRNKRRRINGNREVEVDEPLEHNDEDNQNEIAE
jgi:hypothetical protein